MQKIFFGVLLLSLSVNAFAQTYLVEGIIRDERKQPVPGAVVLLLKPSDSTWTYSAAADSMGHYEIGDVEANSYTAKVIAQGFRETEQKITILDHTTVDFLLQQAENTLNEVMVTDQRPPIETSFGKTTINLEAARTAAGSSALDILRKAPGVRIDGQGNISLNGANVLILVDEKQTYLSGKDLEEYLKSLSGEQLAQIELMTQPSAKYDKEGSGGIINLKTKNTKKKGLHAITNSSVSLAKRVHPAARSNFNINYNTGKLSLFAHAGYVHVQGFLEERLGRSISDLQASRVSDMSQEGFYKETWEDYNLQVGADYKWTSKTKVGMSVKGVYHPNKEKDEIRTVLTDDKEVTFHKTERLHRLYKNSLEGNAYLKYAPGEKSNLAVNLDYIHRDHRLSLLFDSKGYDEQLHPTGNDLLLQSDAPFMTTLYAAKADYETKMSNDFNLEAGLKASLVDIDNANKFQVHTAAGWQEDPVRSNNFIYREHINAAYTNLAKKFSDKWDAQIGLRAEHTDIQGEQLVGNKTISRSFTSLFPVAYIGYKPSEQHQLEINYGRRISRPSYNLLNPFIAYSSPYQYETGNPDLLPSFDHTVELKHNYKNILFTAVELRKRKNIINPVINRDVSANSVVYTYANNANKNVVHTSAYFAKELFKWWNFAASADMYYQAYRLKEESKIFSSGVGYSFSVQNGFSFENSWSVDSAYYWSSGDLQTMIERNRFSQWLSLSVSKKLLKDTAVVKLSLEDPLNAYKQTVVSNWNGVETVSENRYLSQQISLGFTYRFGREKENTERNSNSLEEAKRM